MPAGTDTGRLGNVGYLKPSHVQLDSATLTVPLAAAAPSFFTQTSTPIVSPATSVRTNASVTFRAGTTRRAAERKIPCGTFADQPAASGTSFLPLDPKRALRPFT